MTDSEYLIQIDIISFNILFYQKWTRTYECLRLEEFSRNRTNQSFIISRLE